MNLFESFHPQPASWVRNSNLSPFVSDYIHRLEELQYPVERVRAYTYCVAHFAYWLQTQRIAVQDLNDDVIHGYLTKHLPHCSCPSPVRRTPREARAALRHLLETLAKCGILVRSDFSDPIDEQIELFDKHMQHTMGLAATTRLRRRGVIQSLLHFCTTGQAGLDMPPSAESLRQFLVQELTRVSPGGAGSVTSAVRSFLRFLAFNGINTTHLLPIVVSPAHWRLAPLPTVLSDAEVAQLLDAFPPDLPSNLRGYAMVRCLVDLGLREHEVVGLRLDDIDWNAGTVRIGKGKCRRDDVLPLPQSTGLAIASYLRSERPTTTNRHVFVRHVAPVDKPIKPDVVRNTVRLAYRRCGLPHTRVHILRNTLASRLLVTGGALKEVADILRHRELNTSMIYAKVDIKRLSAVAMPWPGSTT